MQIIKVRNGLLEQDNFYMTSPFQDFLGVGTTRRDGNSLLIDGNDKIERNFQYDNFLVKVRKENWIDIAEEDRAVFYVGTTSDEWGLSEDWDQEQSEYLAISKHDGFIQCYSSDDGKSWTNHGGENLLEAPIVKQGFIKEGSKPLKLMEYSVHSGPYVTVQNFPEGYKAELCLPGGEAYRERLFDSGEKADIYLDYPMRGFVRVYDNNGVKVTEGSEMDLTHGDILVGTDFQLELEYMGVALPEGEISEFATYGAPQMVTLRNVSDSVTYSGLTVSTETDSGDTIEISLDSSTYGATATIDTLPPGGEVNLYIFASRNDGTGTFVSREFTLNVT
jgi:hypothetical protein